MRVLVTRPKPLADAFISSLKAIGYEPIYWPALAILPAEDQAALIQAISNLSGQCYACCVSPSAVLQLDVCIQQNNLAWPKPAAWFVPGGSTKKWLSQYTNQPIYAPDQGVGSEQMVKNPLLQDVLGRAITIFKGQVGNPYLADTLKARGASVSQVICYQSRPAQIKMTEAAFDVVMLTSIDAMKAFIEKLDESSLEKLCETPVVIASEKMLHYGHQCGLKKLIQADSPADESLLKVLEELG